MARCSSSDQVRILFALAGLHRVDRGAEVAFINIATGLANAGHEVTLIGSGSQRLGAPYRFIHVPVVARERFERWPKFPVFRSETAWEEATFVPGLLAKYRPADFDVTATCAFPFTHWALGRPTLGAKQPKHVFITQNGDWPATSNKSEFRFFACDGLVCTNPDYFDRNREKFRCALIPNGVDLNRFTPGAGDRVRFGLQEGPIVLMVSALIPSKKVAEGIKAVADVEGATLVVAGDGPLRDDMRKLADQLLPGRYRQLTVGADEMPALYRSTDVFMHLSTEESFGNVFVEALATGLPIVAIDTPRTRWIIGDDGCFPDTGAPASVAAAIRVALSRRGDFEEVSRRRAEQFGWPAIAARYADFFAELERDLPHLPARCEDQPAMKD